jgi:hypothetical protein
MPCDRDNVKIKIGDTVMRHGCIYIVREIVDWGLGIEILCEDKLNLKTVLINPNEVIKII